MLGDVVLFHDFRPRHARADIQQVRHFRRRDEFRALPRSFADEGQGGRDVRGNFHAGAHLDTGSFDLGHLAILAPRAPSASADTHPPAPGSRSSRK